MPNQALIDSLQAAGLSDNEARVYLAAVATGPTSIQEIARRAGIKRTTVYPVYEALEFKGLMCTKYKGFKKLYAAEHPDKISAVVLEHQRRFQSVLGELTALYNLQSGDSAIAHHEGLEAIKGVYNGLLRDIKPGENYMIISSGSEWYKYAPDFFDDFLARRAKLNINVRALIIPNEFGVQYHKERKVPNEKVRLFKPHVKFTSSILTIPRKVVIHQLEDPVWAMVIENTQIVKTFQELFEILWKSNE